MHSKKNLQYGVYTASKNDSVEEEILKRQGRARLAIEARFLQNILEIIDTADYATLIHLWKYWYGHLENGVQSNTPSKVFSYIEAEMLRQNRNDTGSISANFFELLYRINHTTKGSMARIHLCNMLAKLLNNSDQKNCPSGLRAVLMLTPTGYSIPPEVEDEWTDFLKRTS